MLGCHWKLWIEKIFLPYKAQVQSIVRFFLPVMLKKLNYNCLVIHEKWTGHFKFASVDNVSKWHFEYFFTIRNVTFFPTLMFFFKWSKYYTALYVFELQKSEKREAGLLEVHKFLVFLLKYIKINAFAISNWNINEKRGK